MKNTNLQNSFLLFPFLNEARFKKKNMYCTQIANSTLKLKSIIDAKQTSKILKLFSKKKTFESFEGTKVDTKKGPIVLYSIYFSFSPINTFLHVTDAKGNLKFTFSGGLLGFKGKSKRSRFQILKKFFQELKKLKTGFLKNKPISLTLKNVGTYKKFIIKSLKKKFFIQIIKNYQLHSYNGCRSKKKFRK